MKVRYTRPALADLDVILEYVAAHTPQGAKRVRSRIQASLDLLSLHPMIGTRTDDPDIRRLAVPLYPYLVFYEAAEDEIIVHAVRHAARSRINAGRAEAMSADLAHVVDARTKRRGGARRAAMSARNRRSS